MTMTANERAQRFAQIFMYAFNADDMRAADITDEQMLKAAALWYECEVYSDSGEVYPTPEFANIRDRFPDMDDALFEIMCVGMRYRKVGEALGMSRDQQNEDAQPYSGFFYVIGDVWDDVKEAGEAVFTLPLEEAFALVYPKAAAA